MSTYLELRQARRDASAAGLGSVGRLVRLTDLAVGLTGVAGAAVMVLVGTGSGSLVLWAPALVALAVGLVASGWFVVRLAGHERAARPLGPDRPGEPPTPDEPVSSDSEGTSR